MAKRKLPEYLHIKIPMSRAEAMKYIGGPCVDYDKECASCKSWQVWKRHGYVEVPVEREELLRAILGSEY